MTSPRAEGALPGGVPNDARGSNLTKNCKR